MFINGNWYTTNEKLENFNPATGEKVYEVDKGNGEDVENSIQAAENAFESWSQTSALERSNILVEIYRKMEERKEHLAQVITKEMGKPIKDARGETESAIDYYRWFAEEARRVYGETVPASSSNKKIVVIKQPIGVVGAITPWNFPLSMVARKVAPALAAGCTIILKPSSKAPQSSVEMAKIFEEVGLPKGVFNLVIADSQDTTDKFMRSSAIKKITFTGSTRVGKLLMKKAADTVKRMSMELGGHAPFIVFEDADLEDAAEDLLATKFRCSGQMCTSTNRVFVQDSVAQEFTDVFTEKVLRLHAGNGMEEKTSVGPVIDQNAVKKIKDQIKDAVSKGAVAVTGNLKLHGLEKENGYFVEPTILNEVTKDMDIFTEETFGPVAPIIKFSSETELLEMVNHDEYGLASYLYTDNMSRMIRISEKLEYGMVGVNDPLPFVVQSPFGGFKESGMGKEGGHQGIEGYLEEKLISVKYKENN